METVAYTYLLGAVIVFIATCYLFGPEDGLVSVEIGRLSIPFTLRNLMVVTLLSWITTIAFISYALFYSKEEHNSG